MSHTNHPFMHSIITKYGEWFYRAILLSGVCGLLFLNSRYVTHEAFDTQSKSTRIDFEMISQRVTSMDKTIALMAEQNLVNNRQDKLLEDHEARLRALERRP